MTEPSSAAAQPPLHARLRPLLARICLAVLAAAAVLLPVMGASGLGVQGLAPVDEHIIGAVALLVPAAFAAAVLASLLPRARAHAGLVDVVAFVGALGVGLYVAYAVYAAVADMSQLERQLSAALDGAGKVGLEPACGIAAWVILLPWSGGRAVAGARH